MDSLRNGNIPSMGIRSDIARTAMMHDRGNGTPAQRQMPLQRSMLKHGTAIEIDSQKKPSSSASDHMPSLKRKRLEDSFASGWPAATTRGSSRTISGNKTKKFQDLFPHPADQSTFGSSKSMTGAAPVTTPGLPHRESKVPHGVIINRSGPGPVDDGHSKSNPASKDFEASISRFAQQNKKRLLMARHEQKKMDNKNSVQEHSSSGSSQQGNAHLASRTSSIYLDHTISADRTGGIAQKEKLIILAITRSFPQQQQQNADIQFPDDMPIALRERLAGLPEDKARSVLEKLRMGSMQAKSAAGPAEQQ